MGNACMDACPMHRLKAESMIDIDQSYLSYELDSWKSPCDNMAQARESLAGL
jgi:hypothetical protein